MRARSAGCAAKTFPWNADRGKDVLKIRLLRSPIGCLPKQRDTLKALGLWKIRQEKTHEDTPVVRGMIAVVHHLVEVVEQ